jgi:putative oxidoreductase
MYRNHSCDWAPLPLRLVLGISFLYHGLPKLSSMAGHQNFAGMLAGLGIPAPDLMAWVVGIVETFGGLALLVGGLTRIASFLLVINMLVAMFTVHWQNGYNFLNITGMSESGPVFGAPGYEVSLLYLSGLMGLLIGGAGASSVDRALGRAHVRHEEHEGHVRPLAAHR